QFELVHRAVYRSDAPEPRVELKLPHGFESTSIGTVNKAVAFAPGFMYADATYRVSMHDKQTGLRKESIVLVGADGRRILEVPVVWQRFPFLSTVPSRVFLGLQPVRVFLRCLDEDVELASIASAPAGVRATLASSRELTVCLADHAPRIINGEIEVRTTAAARPPLKVLVIRYAPTAHE
ncbi:MAG: hypothetical protein ACP5XB_27420, partial [Isosphaeraceae bacterium]